MEIGIASEGLSNGKEELEMADPLPRGLAERRRIHLVGSALQEFRGRAAETQISGRIDAVGEVRAHRADGGAVANSEAGRMHHVIEVVQVALFETEGEIADRAVDVAHVMKQDAADVGAQQRKAKFQIVEQQGIAT